MPSISCIIIIILILIIIIIIIKAAPAQEYCAGHYCRVVYPVPAHVAAMEVNWKEKRSQQAKETSLQQRERRARAYMRFYSRLVVVAQAAAVHHTSGSALACVLREFHCRHRQSAAGPSQYSGQPVFPPSSPPARCSEVAVGIGVAQVEVPVAGISMNHLRAAHVMDIAVLPKSLVG